MISLTSRAEPANLPAVRTPTAIALRQPPTRPRVGRIARIVLAMTVFGFPFGGLIMSLIGAGQ